MTRNVWLCVMATCFAHFTIAIVSFGAIRAAEASKLPAFRSLDRPLVFADVPKFLDHANSARGGKVPYRDDPIEYPPLALPFVFAPRLLTGTQSAFVALFAAEMLLVECGIVGLVAWRVARTVGPGAVARRLIWLTAFFAAVCPFVMGRYDAVPALIGFGAALLWSGGKPVLGGFCAALGTLVKVVPGAVAVPGVVFDLRRKKISGGARVLDHPGSRAGVVAGGRRTIGRGGLARLPFGSGGGDRVGGLGRPGALGMVERIADARFLLP